MQNKNIKIDGLAWAHLKLHPRWIKKLIFG